jgi:integrase
MDHEVKGGGVRRPTAKSKTYQMYLTIDGQKRFQSTCTADYDHARNKLKEWEAQAKIGHRETSGLRYEEIRDDYLASGKSIGPVSKVGSPSATQRDFDTFFRNIRVSAIGARLLEFRKWRESQARVLESKAEDIEKEIAYRTMKMMNGRNKLSDVEKAKIEKDATQWVENAVKATTDKRLKYLSAMFYHAFKKTQKISKGDIPYFPILGAKVDNVKQGVFSEQNFNDLLVELPAHTARLRFVNLTGMRSGQTNAITWDMVTDENVLRMSGFLTKNGDAYSLALTDEHGEPYAGTEFLVNQKNRPHGVPVFDRITKKEWRAACAKLKLGVMLGRTYRGAQPHDFRRTAITNFDARGVSENQSMNITGHKTASAHKRYKIGGAAGQRAALAAVSRIN